MTQAPASYERTPWMGHNEAASLEVAGKTVVIWIDGKRPETGEPIVRIDWQPSPPKRLTGEDIAAFDAFKRQAIKNLTVQTETT